MRKYWELQPRYHICPEEAGTFERGAAASAGEKPAKCWPPTDHKGHQIDTRNPSETWTESQRQLEEILQMKGDIWNEQEASHNEEIPSLSDEIFHLQVNYLSFSCVFHFVGTFMCKIFLFFSNSSVWRKKRWWKTRRWKWKASILQITK